MLRGAVHFGSGLRDWSIFGIDVDRPAAVLVAFLKGKATPSQFPQITVIAKMLWWMAPNAAAHGVAVDRLMRWDIAAMTACFDLVPLNTPEYRNSAANPIWMTHNATFMATSTTMTKWRRSV